MDTRKKAFFTESSNCKHNENSLSEKSIAVWKNFHQSLSLDNILPYKNIKIKLEIVIFKIYIRYNYIATTCDTLS